MVVTADGRRVYFTTQYLRSAYYSAYGLPGSTGNVGVYYMHLPTCKLLLDKSQNVQEVSGLNLEKRGQQSYFLDQCIL